MKGANILITNGYFSPIMYETKVNKILNYVSEEQLRNRLEHVLLDPFGIVWIPISCKYRILKILYTLEHIFNKS